MIVSMTNRSSLTQRLADLPPRTRSRYPGGVPVMDQMFTACGKDADAVRSALLSGEVVVEQMITILREDGVSPVAAPATIRRWMSEQHSAAKREGAK